MQSEIQFSAPNLKKEELDDVVDGFFHGFHFGNNLG